MGKVVRFKTQTQSEIDRIMDYIKSKATDDDYFIFVSHNADTGIVSVATNVNADKYNIYLRGLLASGEAMLNQNFPINMEE